MRGPHSLAGVQGLGGLSGAVPGTSVSGRSLWPGRGASFLTLGAGCLAGKLKEWSLILYGTAEHPYNTFTTHQSRSRMLELSTPDLVPPKASLSPSQAEAPEDEEDYTGKGPESQGHSLPASASSGFPPWLLKYGAAPG